MRSPESRSWRPLRFCAELSEAQTIATSIAAMEFEVRLVDGATGRILESEKPEHDPRGPFAVEVPAEHFDDLAGVLDQIMDEQQEFDSFLESWRVRSSRAVRWFLLLAAAAMLLLVLLTSGRF